MHSKKESLLKRWHSLRASPKVCEEKWNNKYWTDTGNCRVISCKNCPSFNIKQQICSINCQNKNVLEIGFGRFKLAKNLIQRSGGTWTGVEPRRPKNEKPVIGKGGYGHATHIPFPDQTFDKIFAIQSMEHWGQKAGGVREPSSYSDCITEISRVLKPGGSIYLDAPVHLHGNEIFIMGDVEKVRSLFPATHWKNVQIEKWREEYSPLERYTPQQNEFNDWPTEITSYPNKLVEEAKANGIVWLLTVSAEKI